MKRCEICYHSWRERLDRDPKRCPKCHTQKWQGVDRRKNNRGADKRARKTKYGWENIPVGYVMTLPVMYTRPNPHIFNDIDERKMVNRNNSCLNYARRHGKVIRIAAKGATITYTRIK